MNKRTCCCCAHCACCGERRKGIFTENPVGMAFLGLFIATVVIFPAIQIALQLFVYRS